MELRKNSFLNVLLESKDTALHLLERLKHSPFLLGYIAVGTIIAFFENGAQGLLYTAANLIILGFFAVIIRMMTTKRPMKAQSFRKIKTELIAGIVLFLLMFSVEFLSFNLTKIPVLQTGFDKFINWAYVMASTLCRHGFPSWSANYIGNAITSIGIELIPTLVLFIVFGYGLLGMGLKPRYWKLTFVLLAFTIIFGLFFHQSYPIYQYPILRTLLLFFIQLFINGLPEELFFRGFLLPRFERILKSPVNALVITSLLFNAFHAAMLIANGNSILIAVLNVLNVGFPSGLLWGYLYQRTRSIVPGMLFHTSLGILGAYFFG